MKKRLLLTIAVIVLIIIIGIIIAIATSNPESADLQTINVSEVTRSVFYSPQYVAIQKGFFEKYGMKIELTTGQGADTVMTSVLSNQVDIGFAGPEASIYVYNEGKEDHTEVFAQLTKRDGSFLVSKTASLITLFASAVALSLISSSSSFIFLSNTSGEVVYNSLYPERIAFSNS